MMPFRDDFVQEWQTRLPPRHPFACFRNMAERTILDRLAGAAANLATPTDYFSGRRAPGVVRADNLLLFLRGNFAELRQSSLENQSHHRFVLLIALRGSADVNLDGVDRRLTPGRALLVFPFQFHFFLRPEGATLQWLVLTFDSDTPEALAPLRDKPVKLEPDALRRLESLLESYLLDAPGTAGETRLTAETLLQRMVRAYRGDASAHPGKASGVSAWLPHINRRLHDGATSEGRIESLARELGVSERLLRLRFQESVGVSLGVYIHHFQLNNAAGLLSRSELPLGEIARRCGYASQAAFSRAFKARTGLAPKDYRARRRA